MRIENKNNDFVSSKTDTEEKKLMKSLFLCSLHTKSIVVAS